MTLPHILLFGATASILIMIQVIRFANRTVKIRRIWDSELDTSSIVKSR